jgi:hypothetical protein
VFGRLVYHNAWARDHVGALICKNLLPRRFRDWLTLGLGSSTNWTHFNNWLFYLFALRLLLKLLSGWGFTLSSWLAFLTLIAFFLHELVYLVDLVLY